MVSRFLVYLWYQLLVIPIWQADNVLSKAPLGYHILRSCLALAIQLAHADGVLKGKYRRRELYQKVLWATLGRGRLEFAMTKLGFKHAELNM